MIPFKYGKVVLGNDFCGREVLVEQIREFIISGQNVLVNGDRRMGKTSLVLESARRAKYRVLYADFMLVRSTEDIISRILRGIFGLDKSKSWYHRAFEMLVHMRPTVSPDPITGLPTMSFDFTPRQAAPESLSEILKLVQKISEDRTVVVFDEFQGILNLDKYDDVFSAMRGEIQHHGNIPYIFSGSNRQHIDKIFTDEDSPFFKSAIPITIGPIPFEEFYAFLSRRFAQGKRKITTDIMQKIFEIAQDIPGDIQQFCLSIWEVTDEGAVIDEDTLKEALTLIFARENESYVSKYLALTKNQVKCTRALAKLGGKQVYSKEFVLEAGITQSSIQSAVKVLIDMNILFESGNDLKFLNPFFRAWVVQQ